MFNWCDKAKEWQTFHFFIFDKNVIWKYVEMTMFWEKTQTNTNLYVLYFKIYAIQKNVQVCWNQIVIVN